MANYFFQPILEASALVYRRGVYAEFPIVQYDNDYYIKIGSGYHKMKKGVKSDKYVCSNDMYSIISTQGIEK